MTTPTRYAVTTFYRDRAPETSRAVDLDDAETVARDRAEIHGCPVSVVDAFAAHDIETDTFSAREVARFEASAPWAPVTRTV